MWIAKVMRGPMNSLDTNVVLRYLLDDIPGQTEKVKGIIANSACYITDVVTAEVIFVLEKALEVDRQDIVKLVKAFLSLPNIVYNDYFLDEAIDQYGAEGSLSIIDCYAATEAKVYNNSLFTFDKGLIKHGGSHVKEP